MTRFLIAAASLASSAWLLLIAVVCVACITYTLAAEARSRREKPNPYPPPPGMAEWRAKHWLRANREPGQLPDVDDAGRWRKP